MVLLPEGHLWHLGATQVALPITLWTCSLRWVVLLYPGFAIEGAPPRMVLNLPLCYLAELLCRGTLF